MERLKKVASWLIRHASGLGYLVGLLLSASFFPTLLALSREASPFDYGVAAIAGVLVFVVVRAAWMRAQLWSDDAKLRRRLTEGKSPFDPMERVHRDKRLFLSDLAPAGRKEVKSKTFINCEIIGPGNIVVDIPAKVGDPLPHLRNVNLTDVDCIQISGEVLPKNAVQFAGCDFIDCEFFSLSLLFVHRTNESLTWITPKLPPVHLEPPCGEGAVED